GATVFPATAYLELMRGVGVAHRGEAIRLTSLTFVEALVLDPEAERDVRAVLTGDDDGHDTVEIWSRLRGDPDGAWTLHASGGVRGDEGAAPPAPQPEVVGVEA